MTTYKNDQAESIELSFDNFVPGETISSVSYLGLNPEDEYPGVEADRVGVKNQPHSEGNKLELTVPGLSLSHVTFSSGTL
ncbi:MAG: hypothetical protein V7744_14890 [Pseudomonadales bacterium]